MGCETATRTGLHRMGTPVPLASTAACSLVRAFASYCMLPPPAGLRVWHKLDTTFKTPRAAVHWCAVKERKKDLRPLPGVC
jgi:hypothetical protein